MDIFDDYARAITPTQKGIVQFVNEQPLSDDVLRDFIQSRMDEIDKNQPAGY